MIKDGWSRIYRKLALLNAIIAAAWTLILITRIKPLSYLLPIMAEGAGNVAYSRIYFIYYNRFL
jgi:hypothetical protein